MKSEGIITNTICSHSYVKSKKVKLLETETRMVVARVWRMGEMERYWSKGYKLSYKIDNQQGPTV